MLGHRVFVSRVNGTHFKGVLLDQNANGVVVESRNGYQTDWRKVFIPYSQIVEIEDQGRA